MKKAGLKRERSEESHEMPQNIQEDFVWSISFTMKTMFIMKFEIFIILFNCSPWFYLVMINSFICQMNIEARMKYQFFEQKLRKNPSWSELCFRNLKFVVQKCNILLNQTRNHIIAGQLLDHQPYNNNRRLRTFTEECIHSTMKSKLLGSIQTGHERIAEPIL